MASQKITQGADMVVENLPVRSAVVQPEKNGRKDYSQVPKLQSDIARDGRLLQPVIGFRNADGTWTLVAGFCRMMAVQNLGWPTIPVNIIPQPANDKVRALINGRENLARDNLTSYDKARYLCDLVETHKMTFKEVAKELSGDCSLNDKNVALYVRAARELDGEVLEAWQAGHKMASTMRLFALLKHPKEQQKALWDSLIQNEAAVLKDAGVADAMIADIIANPYDAEKFERAVMAKPGRGRKGVSTQVSDVSAPGENKGNGKVTKPDRDTLEFVEEILSHGIDQLDASVADGMRRAILWCTGRLPVLNTSDGVLIFDPAAHSDAVKARVAKTKDADKAKREALAAQAAQAKAEEKLAKALAKLAEQGISIE